MRSIPRLLPVLLALLVALPLAPTAAGQTAEPPPRDATMMRLGENWRIDGDLPVHSLLISLQGLANRSTPELYFIYPPAWTFTFTESVYDYYGETHNISFDEIDSAQEALDRFAQHAKGYVVWDDDVRTSLIVAFTIAGLEDAVVVNEALIPLAEAHGLAPIDDLRGRYTGQTDHQIYADAWARYGDRTSKDYIVWMGGVHGAAMEPGVAGFGIYQRAFFTDLSANPEDQDEYWLADEILDTMNPGGLVMGWHSYAKDTEGQHVTLVSQHALRMEGLNSLPNTSFNTHIPTTPGYRFENNHNVRPGETLVPEQKVYVAAVQTDGLGLGAWLKPGRGQMPYAWEVTMNWSWMSPALLQYFYQQATPNDYFIGVLSGPGYMYPKAIPDDRRPALIEEARVLTDSLDINVFEIMDYSEGTRTLGNLDLTREVVDDYYEGMPDALGFINGYGPANTYDIRDGRPLVSFDYYLGENRPTEEAVADLQELARMNSDRPYFLLLHVRQWSTIEHVKGILDRLGPEVEVVPLDVFLRLAAHQPDFEPRFAPPIAPWTAAASSTSPGSPGPPSRSPRRTWSFPGPRRWRASRTPTCARRWTACGARRRAAPRCARSAAARACSSTARRRCPSGASASRCWRRSRTSRAWGCSCSSRRWAWRAPGPAPASTTSPPSRATSPACRPSPPTPTSSRASSS